MVFIREIKVGKHTYLAEVKSVRKGGKVKQEFIRYIGKKNRGKTIRHVSTENMGVENVKSHLDVAVIHKLMNELTITNIENKDALALVFSQLLERKSISKLESWFTHTEVPNILQKEISTKSLYQGLRQLADSNFTKIEQDIFNSLSHFEKDETAAIIDVTDTYFEGKTIPGKKRRGKDSKVRKLLQIALAVTLKHGFPIFHEDYSGNISDIQIFRDMIIKLKERNLNSVIVDRGMLSKESLAILLGLSCEVIAGLRKTPTIIKEHLSKIKREEIYALKTRVKLINTTVHIQSVKYNHGKLIIVFNPSLEVLKRELNFQKGIDQDTSYTGYSLIFHNTKLSDEEAVRKYFEKDVVERAFKQLKGILNLRPIRTWLKEHTQGHIRICYLAYAILSLMNYKLKKIQISAPEALASFKQGYKINLQDKKTGFKWDLTVDLEPQQRKMLKALGHVVTKN